MKHFCSHKIVLWRPLGQIDILSDVTQQNLGKSLQEEEFPMRLGNIRLGILSSGFVIDIYQRLITQK